MSFVSKTICLYGIPAYGHIHSNLYLAGTLAKEGFRIVYYSLEPFREVIEANGCEYRAYSLRESPDLSDGRRILRLYRLILQSTEELLPVLLEEAERERPCAVIFESLALWGRAVGQLLHVPAFAFYSIAAIDPVTGKGLLSYLPGFSADFLRYAGELPEAYRLRRCLRRRYGLGRLSLLPVLMNKGGYNLMGYSGRFQPGGGRFGPEYLFLGPLAVRRKVTERNDFVCPEGPLIYISLGTVFDRDERLLREIVRQFGRSGGAEGPVYHVVMAGKMGTAMDRSRLPENFIVRPFVNQGEVMRHAGLFITAGGMNSIHEALYYGVPCLLCPQQGEQLLNAKRFEKLGFGRILRNPRHLLIEAQEAMGLKARWDERIRKEMTAAHMEGAMELFRRLQAGDAGGGHKGAYRPQASMTGTEETRQTQKG